MTTKTTAQQRREYRGPAILSFGFRPFFLGGALWAVLAVALWLPMLSGRLALPSTLAPLAWHAHELIYGFVPAIVAGFLLTASPNWTGRLPVAGGRLAGLFLLWLAGRLAVLLSASIGAVPSAIIDMAFLVALIVVVGRELIAGKNWRNLKVLGLAGLLGAGNAVFHYEAAFGRGPDYGIRAGIAVTILLIMLVGGRIIPSFTRNWLAKRQPGRLPAAFGKFDAAVLSVSAAALAAWVLAPAHDVTAALGLLAAISNVARLVRWAGDRTAEEPLVQVLHVAYAFVPIGFGLVALAIVRPALVTPAGALHAWTVGAIGMMTLAVMTRASLGHTGQPLTATRPIQLIYLAAFVAACARIAAAFDVARDGVLHLSAGAWMLAFAGFVAVYAPLLCRRRA